MGAIDLDVERLGPKPLTPTHRAGRTAHVAAQTLLDIVAVRLLESAAQVRDHALEAESEARFVDLGCAVHENPSRGLRQFLVPHGLFDPDVIAEPAQRSAVIHVHSPAVLAPRFDRTVAKSRCRIRYDQRLVEFTDHAQPVAFGAGAVRGVEGEESRR